MTNPQGVRASSRPSNDPLQNARVEQRRVVDSDLNQLRTNDRNLTNSVGKTNLRNVSPSQEFNRQIRTEALKSQGRINAQGLKQVASKMYMAGYSSQAIQKAMRHSNGKFSKMSRAEFNKYFNRNISPALKHPKVARGRQQNEAFKKQHGIPKSYNNMKGLKAIDNRVRQRQQKQVQARQQRQQQTIAQNRKQGLQRSRTR